jgi:hypothetical protein
MDDPSATKANQSDRPVVARFKSDRGSRRDIEAHAEGDSAIKIERLVNLKKMKMRADLNRAITGVDYYNGSSVTTHISHYIFVGKQVFARYH